MIEETSMKLVFCGAAVFGVRSSLTLWPQVWPEPPRGVCGVRRHLIDDYL